MALSIHPRLRRPSSTARTGVGSPGITLQFSTAGAAPGVTHRAGGPIRVGPVADDELGSLIEAAQRETDRRLGPTRPPPAGADGVHRMLTSIRAQLDFMAGVVASGSPPTVEQVNRLTLGVIAVREYEADDLAYCDLLCEAVYRFKALLQRPDPN